MNENNTQNGSNQNNNGYSSFSPNNYNGPVVVANAVPEKNGGKAVASLVCGILSILGSWSFVSIDFCLYGFLYLFTRLRCFKKKENRGCFGNFRSTFYTHAHIGNIIVYRGICAAVW